ncbi:acetyl/propionyl/methylcrotonyl-CoA carboxylase subunit alpha [Rhodococcus sp. IEGM 1330]|uniref:acetyl-CoA carboxylase biotin carboxylase subunit n=1 Tax=Rhodococcus sp. IEGM 1330 TaxID=3082225 RepID=UPI0029558656|nr:biotin carboxylase N-terminal domain-containing protein [Rhodococcus sp. IEGM 1330]MDV8022723.1 biotin carboxylase N-terminal domain-containing protein [Rhodococcus sp. IEGM 1330]
MTNTQPVVLVANRGEIAVRVVTAARRIGASPVLVVSVADINSRAAQLADRVIVIGPAQAGKSYLRPEYVAEAAKHAGADVVHPGYGFLSEQPELAELLESENIAFAGPRPETLRAVGDKSSARKVAVAAGVPVAAAAEIDNVDNVVQLAESIGYPLLIKAVHGGGGRGIRLVDGPESLKQLAPQAASEAQAAFGSGALYLERFYPAARHVEVQVFGDGQGGAQIFGDRDCSVQRRHQKLIEECPAWGLADTTRTVLHDSSRALVEALRYRGAGTVEFLVDIESGDVVFLEMNARIQVEHPVTEEAFGIDLVAAQLRLALGQDPQLPNVPPVPSSAVIELRINAEDPNNDFRPSPGVIEHVSWPVGPGVRVDTHVFDGYAFPPFYDSLMAKLIVRAHNREAAVAAVRAAALAVVVEGVTTTLPMHDFVLGHPDFVHGGVSTSWFGPVWEQHRAERKEERP